MKPFIVTLFSFLSLFAQAQNSQIDDLSLLSGTWKQNNDRNWLILNISPKLDDLWIFYQGIKYEPPNTDKHVIVIDLADDDGITTYDERPIEISNDELVMHLVNPQFFLEKTKKLVWKITELRNNTLKLRLISDSQHIPYNEEISFTRIDNSIAQKLIDSRKPILPRASFLGKWKVLEINNMDEKTMREKMKKENKNSLLKQKTDFETASTLEFRSDNSVESFLLGDIQFGKFQVDHNGIMISLSGEGLEFKVEKIGSTLLLTSSDMILKLTK